MNPDVSVIIPTYNRASELPRAVQSVLAQTYRDFEVVIVDDCSCDDTPQTVAVLAARDGRIRHLRHESNRGAQAARNTGIHAARGNWVAFLDSDDEWLPDSLEARLQVAYTERVDVVHSDCYVVQFPAATRTPHGAPPLSGQIYRTLLWMWGVLYPSLLVRKSALEQIGDLDESIVSHQEWDTAIRLAKSNRFGFLARPTFTYYRCAEGTISSDKLNQAIGYRQVVEKHKQDILSILGRKYLARHYYHVAQLYRDAGDKSEARRCHLLSVRSRPFGGTAVRGMIQLLRCL